MKITLFTSNNPRHVYLINLLAKICDELFVVQESKKIFTDIVSSRYSGSIVIKEYFENVNNAQKKIFGNSIIDKSTKNIKIFPIQHGDLNQCSLDSLSKFLESDYYIVFGSSFIKGDLINFLVEKKAINIHAGVSPYYRGTDCNFWALHDNNPHLVGATIHMLSKGLDSGPILYHAMSNHKSSSFEYTMSALKSAFCSIAERIKSKSIFEIEAIAQDRSKEIKYSKKSEFNEKVVKKYLNKKIDLLSNEFDISLLKNPYFL